MRERNLIEQIPSSRKRIQASLSVMPSPNPPRIPAGCPGNPKPEKTQKIPKMPSTPQEGSPSGSHDGRGSPTGSSRSQKRRRRAEAPSSMAAMEGGGLGEGHAETMGGVKKERPIKGPFFRRHTTINP